MLTVSRGDVLAGAIFDRSERYRYLLWRDLIGGTTGGAGTCLFIMLNPSTADEQVLDPTVRRCLAYARRWGFRRLEVCNLFALRSTDPRALYEAGDPVGVENDAMIATRAADADQVIAAWGVHGAHLGRAERVAKQLAARGVVLHTLGITKDGHPRHPLYLRGDAVPTVWTPSGISA